MNPSSPTSPLGGESLLSVFKSCPETAQPLIEYHEALMRGPSPLSAAEREWIAAYVSQLDRCDYCRDIHAAVACSIGTGMILPAQEPDETEKSPPSELLRILAPYIRKLTLSPGSILPSDIEAVLAS